MSTQETKPEPRRPKLRLPFDNRREDAGEWAFDHRAGLCVTLIAYLLLAIAFVGAKIVVGGRPAAQGFYIDLQQLEQLAAEKERLEREVRRRQQQEPIDWKSIRNDVSNENAKLDESLRDDRGTNTAALNDAADAAQERMRANREAYERGLAEAEAIRRRRERTDERGESSDRKVQGRVTVSFSLVDPVRHARHLVVPAYQCEGGGEVVVRITVNRAGEVTHVGGLRRRRLHARDGGARRPQFGLRHQRRGSRPPHGDDHLHLHSAVARPKPSTRPHPEKPPPRAKALFARDMRSASRTSSRYSGRSLPCPAPQQKRFRCLRPNLP